jgi:hypothetical protein
MSYSSTQHVITIDQYAEAPHVVELLDAIEGAVRRSLTAGGEQSLDDVTIEWAARLPGYDTGSPDGRRWVPWERQDAPPARTDLLGCRGRRLS